MNGLDLRALMAAIVWSSMRWTDGNTVEDAVNKVEEILEAYNIKEK